MMRIRHVKLPVGDLKLSTLWYQRLLGLDLVAEFAEGGVVRGVSLKHPDGGFIIALRDRAVCAGNPHFPGFDLFAIDVDSADDLKRLAAHCDAIGVEHRGILDNGEYGRSLDIPDPDGTVLRFLHDTIVGRTGSDFLGFDFTPDGPALYTTPREFQG